MRRRSMFSAAVIALASTSVSLGQVITPPPGPPPAKPEFTPPPRRTPSPAQNVDPAEIERVVREARQARQPQIDAESLELAGLEKPLGAGDDYEGPVPLYEENLHYIALERNPLIDEDQRAVIEHQVRLRFASLQDRAVENLQTVIDIEGGLIDEVSFDDFETLAVISRSLQELILQSFLTDDLLRARAIDIEEAAVNRELLRRYQVAMGGSDPAQATDMFRVMMMDAARESLDAFDALLFEGTTRWDAVFAEIEDGEIPGDVETQIRAVATAEGDIGTLDLAARRDIANRIKLIWRSLSLEDKKTLSSAILATRSEPTATIIPPLDLTYPGKVTMTTEEILEKQKVEAGNN
ncbi:MAG: hypothetical protein AAGI17_10940 [Planctomycetota bacterium]